ncbi:hypothetical protein ACTMTI_22755 [Nonomuraea sp. H19]|uniref:hypothetical protein n=1 Tax=Nonomuraea sp. H19 TaxID=3452206 RepID=UPI003F8CB94E
MLAAAVISAEAAAWFEQKNKLRQRAGLDRQMIVDQLHIANANPGSPFAASVT